MSGGTKEFGQVDPYEALALRCREAVEAGADLELSPAEYFDAFLDGNPGEASHPQAPLDAALAKVWPELLGTSPTPVLAVKVVTSKEVMLF